MGAFSSNVHVGAVGGHLHVGATRGWCWVYDHPDARNDVDGNVMALTSVERSRRFRSRHPDRTKASAKRRYASEHGKAVRHAYDASERGKALRRAIAVSGRGKALRRAGSLRYKYGIEEADYRRMWGEQEGCCALCCRPLSGIVHVDHDHRSGKIRGLLHLKCNAAMGMLDRDLMRLRLAATYLDKHTPVEAVILT